MTYYNITSDEEFNGATVILSDGSTHTIGNDNINYQTLVNGLLSGGLSDDQILELVSPFELVYRTLTRLSERVSRKGNKLLFDGDVTDNSLTKHIIQIMNGGGSEEEWVAYVNFMEKLYTNPSAESREHLFHFIEAHGLLLTPDGDVVFYKSTLSDGTSTYAGYGVVDGQEFENDHLPNHVGAIVELPRSMVDGDRSVACSVGLHVCAYSYAKTYSQRMWTVIVNPRDIVSVPSDHNNAKVRVSRYVVAEENPHHIKYEGTVKTFNVRQSSPSETIEVADQSLSHPNGSRIPEYKKTILALVAADPEVNLSRYKNKKVTQKQRESFRLAAEELGFEA